jgi:N-methylhydantoinase B/oxoprolinase/acetone carboxylase alpha subunit
MDGITLEILWSNLIATVTDQARALQRIAFSPIVREAGDLATAFIDRQGRMVAQAVTGTPGHINSLGSAGKHFVGAFPPDTLSPGDVLITNDPWMSAGHFFDISVMTPVFRKDRCIGFFGSTIHHTDIGGYGVGAGARDVHEEGLWIPLAKLYEAGRPNALLFDIIRRNVRTPGHVSGDLAAQVAGARVGAERLNALCDRHGLDDVDDLAEAILARSEQATRDSIRALRPGTYHGESVFDVPGGLHITLRCALTVDADAGEMVLDFAGSSGEVPIGINCVKNYAAAYANFAVRSCLDPELPNNFGSLTPVRFEAPEGSIVNCRYPAPVNARHVVGMYTPFPVLKALHQVMPERVVAEGSGAVWTIQIQGRDDSGEPFTSSMFNYSGGMGARREKPGLSATCYPTGVAAVPVEVLEAAMPIEFTRKELRPGSGGTGRQTGGDGQYIGWRMRTDAPWLLNVVASRTDVGPEGLEGGGPGQAGRFLVNGVAVNEARKMTMQPADEVMMETPGGGGYGSPA